jgi:hypothetical protein
MSPAQRHVLAAGMTELANIFLGVGILTPIFSGQASWWIAVVGSLAAAATYVSALLVAGTEA